MASILPPSTEHRAPSSPSLQMLLWHHPLMQHRKHHQMLLFLQPVIQHVATIRKTQHPFPGNPAKSSIVSRIP